MIKVKNMQENDENSSVSLIPYYPNYETALAWYQDLQLCKQVDNIDYVYSCLLYTSYIRLQNMSIEYRNFIKNKFVSATGRFDIFTCFLEKSDKLLSENGKMCLITSNKYLTANYGKGIREYLSQTGHVRKLVDLYDTKFFGAAVLPAIIMCENRKSDNVDVDYIGIKTTERCV